MTDSVSAAAAAGPCDRPKGVGGVGGGRDLATTAATTTATTTALLFCALVLLTLLHRTHGIEWLAVVKRRDAQWNKTSDCLPLTTAAGAAAAAAAAAAGAGVDDGLTQQQRRICRRTVDLMPAVVLAGQQTMYLCQSLFFDTRWNCSSIARAPRFTPDLTQGSREQSVVYALATASLGHSVAKSCSVGTTSKCSCGPLPVDLPKADFRWGGCSDNIRFGVAFSRVFADQKATRTPSKKSLMNAHNSNVGRKKLAMSLGTACKCHGVSGSCSVKTCWKALPDLRVIGSALLNSYYVAVEVRKARGRESTKRNETMKMRLESMSMTKKTFTDDDLIYYNKSPDYCLPDTSLGSMGTHDRECLKENSGSIGCQSMCCGRGFRSQLIERSYRCDCKYYWCCYVKCKICTTTVEVNRCR